MPLLDVGLVLLLNNTDELLPAIQLIKSDNRLVSYNFPVTILQFLK